MGKSKRTIAVDISKSVKDAVWERDQHRCIICGDTNAFPNAHFISRARGGLGIEENIVTLCSNFAPCKCHYKYDFGTKEEQEELGQKIETYLKSKYPNWDRQNLIYKKGM